MQKLYKINIEGEEYTVGYPASVLVGQLEEELETLRASNTIKQANIELLEAENAKLIAEREAMMKQEPYGYVNTVNKSFYQSHHLHDKKRLCEMLEDGEMIKVYQYQLPAQQIPEGWKVQKHIIAGTEIEEIILTSPEDFHVAFRCYEDSDFGHPKNVIFRYFSQLSASQPKSDM